MEIPAIFTSPSAGNAAFTAVAGVSSYIKSQKQAEELASLFSKGNVRALKHQNPALRKKYRELDDEWKGSAIGTVVSIVGGMAGGALLGFFVPIWGAAFVGTLIGGYLGNKLYTDAFVEQAQDPALINLNIVKLQKDGQQVPTELVGAALMANLSGKDGKMAGKILKNLTGTELFTEALADPKNVQKLQAMLNNPAIDGAIRAKTGMPMDLNPDGSIKSVAQQYAELINSGQMRAENMLNIGEGMYVLQAAAQGVPYNIDVPDVPTGRASHSKRR